MQEHWLPFQSDFQSDVENQATFARKVLSTFANHGLVSLFLCRVFFPLVQWQKA